MRSLGASATSMNAAVSALRFFFGVTLGRGDAQVGMTTVREPRKLPVVLSPEEVARLLDAAPGLKYLSLPFIQSEPNSGSTESSMGGCVDSYRTMGLTRGHTTVVESVVQA